MEDVTFSGNIFVVANECFSDNSSNGRTLKNMLGSVAPEHLAQFYIHGTPDRSFCGHYFQVSDLDALNSLIPWKRGSKSFYCNHVSEAYDIKPTNDAGSGVVAKESRKIAKNCRNRYFRDLVWRTYRWWGEDFTNFISDFQPNIVLLQAGDLPIMFDIAMKVAKSSSASLMMYNSEGYVLKDILYNGASKRDFWHNILQYRLKSIYAKFMTQMNYCIYSTEYLEKSYQNAYPHPQKSGTMYTVSEMQVLPDNTDPNQFELLYCGNLGVGRAAVLNVIAEELFRLDESAVLSIFGKFISDEDRQTILKNRNVKYGGIVPYAEVTRLMSKASMVLHCENGDRVVNLRYAFSTKIADCLASGRPFLVFAGGEFPFVEYLRQNDCCHIATSVEELRNVLKMCLRSVEYRKKYSVAAIELAHRNHNKTINDEKIDLILSSLYK